MIAVVLAALAGGVWWWLGVQRARAERAAAAALVADLAAAYERGDLAGVPASVPDLAQRFTAATEGLGARAAVDRGPVEVDDSGARSELTVTWTFPRERTWSYGVDVELARTGVEAQPWEVVWTPALVHPQLAGGERLRASRELPERGDVLDARGEAIVTSRPVVEVSVQPSRVEDADELAAELEDQLDIDGAALAERIDEASGDAPIPVITLREDDYAEVEDAIYPLPGTAFRRTQLPLAPTREFARAFLGSVGEVTAEQLEQEPERYERGDVVGRSGLQQALDDRLRGSAGLVVEAVREGDGEQGEQGGDAARAAGDAGDEGDEGGGGEAQGEGDGEAWEEDEGDGGGTQARVLHEVAPEHGSDVAITLRRRVQRAADDVLADVERPSALVAIDVPSGDVVAIANGPGAPFDIATGGQYPPGSIFKVVTTARLLADGLGPGDSVACPGSVTVEGRAFGNAEDAQLGDVPFSSAFAQSCNTAFVGLSQDLQAGDLRATAEEHFGIGTRGDLGVGAYAGQIPREDSAVEVAAAAIGQGEVLVSPLVAADIAATVARGHWQEPRVLAEPEPGDRGRGDDLPRAGVLQRLTRAVVTEGSGSALAGVPGPGVHGKTGTAEYGDEDPPRTHAWFIGYQGDLAFAVLVAETADSFGGQVAAPIAAEFLAALRGS